MLNFKAIINVLGMLIALSGIAMLLAVPFSIYYGSEDLSAILISSLGTVVMGGGLWLGTRKGLNTELRKKDGYLVVTFGWIVMSLIGALPYYLAKFSIGEAYPIQTFTDAFFETMSGFTTTGASILGENIEALPQGLHFWRAMTHWIGGMGIIVLTIAILPLLGIGGMQLYAAEVPGPTPDKLTPRVRETAKRLWIIYFGLTAVEAILLLLGDMNFYEAVCHAMATLSTGGFSTSQASLGGFSAYSQYVVTVFMFLAGTNFALTYFAIRGKPLRLWANEEFRTYLYVCLLLITVVAGILIYNGKYGVEESIRAAAFQVVGIITTTGFGTAAFYRMGQLPPGSLFCPYVCRGLRRFYQWWREVCAYHRGGQKTVTWN
jgi:trk system potassium uptake protein TrkH